MSQQSGGPGPDQDPRDAKDRRDTGVVGIASALMVAIGGAGLVIEGLTGGGPLLVAIGVGVLVAAAAVAYLSWRFAHGG
jgi:hypothetical protein